MKLKIVGDGTPLGTHVFDAETGAPIEGVNYIVYEQDIVGPGRVLLGLQLESIDVVVNDVDLVKDEGISEGLAQGVTIPMVPELTNA